MLHKKVGFVLASSTVVDLPSISSPPSLDLRPYWTDFDDLGIVETERFPGLTSANGVTPALQPLPQETEEDRKSVSTISMTASGNVDCIQSNIPGEP